MRLLVRNTVKKYKRMNKSSRVDGLLIPSPGSERKMNIILQHLYYLHNLRGNMNQSKKKKKIINMNKVKK